MNTRQRLKILLWYLQFVIGTSSVVREFIPTVFPLADANVYPQYEIQNAAWIWHPYLTNVADSTTMVVTFRNDFATEADSNFLVHLSADQAYECSLDGQLISIGPDRSDVQHWSFSSYRVSISRGTHSLNCLVWWIGDNSPQGTLTYKPGFIFRAEGSLSNLLTTGNPNSTWFVQQLNSWRFQEQRWTGASQVIDPSQPAGPWLKPIITQLSVDNNQWGESRDWKSWGLFPSPLPDRLFARTPSLGSIRAVINKGLSPTGNVSEADTKSPRIPEFTKLLQGNPILIEKNITLSILWDLNQYICAYPYLVLSGGNGANITISWAESLYETDGHGKITPTKGNRSEVVGKMWIGVNDYFLSSGTPSRDYRTCTWRSGRYVLLTVNTMGEPLTIEEIALFETRYPTKVSMNFESSDSALDATLPILLAGIQMSSHQFFADGVYYESLMYVGDTRIESLVTYGITSDTRLIQRALDVFDFSRSASGLIEERYTSQRPQQSPTYSMLWTSLLNDFLMWRFRDNPTWFAEKVRAMRSSLEEIRGYLDSKTGLLGYLPGWPFMDWVNNWSNGIAPDGKNGPSSLDNLLFIITLMDAANIEKAVGDTLMETRNLNLLASLRKQVFDKFWDEERSLMADTIDHKKFSEHAQCLSILAEAVPDPLIPAMLSALTSSSDLARTSIYFTHYCLEAFYKMGRGDLLMPRFQLWKDLVKLQLRCTVEEPEPTRSDCHGWSTHPLYHYHASLCGIRPADTGFKSVFVSPVPGTGLGYVNCLTPHPDGNVQVQLKFVGKTGVVGEVSLPQNTSGTFVYQGSSTTLAPGTTTKIDFP